RDAGIDDPGRAARHTVELGHAGQVSRHSQRPGVDREPRRQQGRPENSGGGESLDEADPRYSSRNATIGSSRAARRAGTHDATRAIVTTSITIAANVSGSVGLTPTSMLVMTRVTAAAAR